MTIASRFLHAVSIAAWQTVGALLIGVATIFVMKNDPREHWAIPPDSRLVLVLNEAGHPDDLFSPMAYTEIDGLRWPRALLA